MIFEKELTEKIIESAIEVHRHLGPGLLEIVYEECLCHELTVRCLHFARQVPLPLVYKGIPFPCGYRMDVVVDNRVILELKCVEALLPVHVAQLLSYMRLSRLKVGLLLNFHVALMKTGIKRLVL